MAEKGNAKNVKDDEIDLLDLFTRMGRSLNRISKSLGQAFLILIVFLIRRWLPLTLSIVLGVGFSYLFKMTSESFYTSDLVLRTNTVPASDMISYLNRLHTYCIENNSTALSEAISLNPIQLKNISDINAFWIIDKGRDRVPDMVDYDNNHDIYDTINVRMMDRLDVRVRIKLPQELSTVKMGIIKFINSDSLFQQRNRVRLVKNSQMLARLDYDIQQLDSLQKYKYSNENKKIIPQTGGQLVFLQEQKTQLVYTDIYNLYTQKQSLEEERDLYKELVTTLSEFTIPAKRVNGLIYYSKRILPEFFLFTILFLVIHANRKKLLEIYKKY
jgi:hypothetical protein